LTPQVDGSVRHAGLYTSSASAPSFGLAGRPLRCANFHGQAYFFSPGPCCTFVRSRCAQAAPFFPHAFSGRLRRLRFPLPLTAAYCVLSLQTSPKRTRVSPRCMPPLQSVTRPGAPLERAAARVCRAAMSWCGTSMSHPANKMTVSLPSAGAANVDGDPLLLSDLLAEPSASPTPLASRVP